MAYITIDFGSANSGAIINPASGKDYNPNQLIYVHCQDGFISSTKQPTIFWIKKNLLNAHIQNDELNIYSCVFYEDQRSNQETNFIWCSNQIKETLDILSADLNNWVCFRNPKMELYNDATEIKGSDGEMYDLKQVLSIFFKVIKAECLKKASDANIALGENDIKWAITVPGLVIWNQHARQTLQEVVEPIYGQNISLFSKPECALIGVNISGRGTSEIDFKEGRYSMVIDLGGGTTDICVMKEVMNQEGLQRFEEIKSTPGNRDSTTSVKCGGNEIDRRFVTYFCNYLSQGTNISEPSELYNGFINTFPSGGMEFEKKWRELRYSGEINSQDVYFLPGYKFTDWVHNYYPETDTHKENSGFYRLDGKKLQEFVFEPVYRKILSSIKENLDTLRINKIDLEVVYFAGGLSLDKALIKEIEALIREYFPIIQIIKKDGSAAIAAVQTGGNHLSVNKKTLIQRLARKTFYIKFKRKYHGDMAEFKAGLKEIIKNNYERMGIWLDYKMIDNLMNSQSANIEIDYSKSAISYMAPICIGLAPIRNIQPFEIKPLNDTNTRIKFTIWSSNDKYQIFPNDKLLKEGEFTFDFKSAFHKAYLQFSSSSNAVEGSSSFVLLDKDYKKVEEFAMQGVIEQ